MAGEYEKLRILGSGTFGKSWLSQCKSSQTEYVLKEINAGNATRVEIQQTVADLLLICELKHENIIEYLTAYVEDRGLFLVQQYADAGNLEVRIKEQGNIHFTECLILNWLIQMTMGLAFLHTSHILHRNLNPNNIVFTSDNCLKLTDYGLTEVLSDKCYYGLNFTRSTHYLSPEICQNEEYNSKSDIWSLGCILYQLCSLRVPFQAPEFTSLLMTVQSGAYDPIPRHYGLLLQDLVAVMLRIPTGDRPSIDQILSVPDLQPYISEYRHNESGSIKIIERKRQLPSPFIQPGDEKKDKHEKTNEVNNDIGFLPPMEVPFDENHNVILNSATLDGPDDCDKIITKAEEKEIIGCYTPEKRKEEEMSIDHKTPVSKTPEYHLPADCFSVESPKKMRLTVSPLMKARMCKQRAAYSCEKGMKLNVGNQGLGEAPIMNLCQPFTSVRRSRSVKSIVSRTPDKNLATPPVMSPSEIMNDSGLPDSDVFAAGLVSGTQTSSDTNSATGAVSTPFRVPLDRPRRSVPVVDMREVLQYLVDIKIR
ncbi:serine/threonine-protein kinase Nek5 isoform X2 [Patella vulgata]|uniref:serine/threonine-protein kinase Nek5 isoform X2 n=1 Tax=Patella vulgata TaxID=6465 RepID=UPI00217F5505|nr:serine/threonine-protein kinase Nek5 isoform X2 [Patella vulgata]